MRYKETKQKLLGAWYTPEHLVKEMINMVPAEWWVSGIFLEPTAGDGNLVIGLLNELVVKGIDPQTAIMRVKANELDKEESQKCTDRVKDWCKQYNFDTEWTCMNEDAISYKFTDYDYIFANLPFGSNGNSHIPSLILKNIIIDKKGVVMTKNHLRIKHCVKYNTYKFPNIKFKVKASLIDYNYNNTDNEVWFDKYKDLFDKDCKWRDDEGNTKLAKLIWYGNTLQLVEIVRKKQVTMTNKFNFTDEEIDKLSNISYTDREIEYLNELKDNSLSIPLPVIYHVVNRVLGNGSTV